MIKLYILLIGIFIEMVVVSLYVVFHLIDIERMIRDILEEVKNERY